MENELKQHRRFGLLLGGIFGLIGIWPLVVRGEDLRLWAVVLGSLLVVPGLACPARLKPIYTAWMAVGHVWGLVNTRIILGAIYFGMITPMGFMMRRLGMDSMGRRYQPHADTYRVHKRLRPRAHMLRQF